MKCDLEVEERFDFDFLLGVLEGVDFLLGVLEGDSEVAAEASVSFSCKASCRLSGTGSLEGDVPFVSLPALSAVDSGVPRKAREDNSTGGKWGGFLLFFFPKGPFMRPLPERIASPRAPSRSDEGFPSLIFRSAVWSMTHSKAVSR